MRAPEFWYAPDSLTGALASAVLSPAAAVFGAAGALRRAVTRPWRAPVPVICVGNLTVGGTGKTPTALSIVDLLRDRGRTPHVLTRGYRGRLRGPVRVDFEVHAARDVGDEALLLARAAPTWVARDRAADAKAAVAAGADILVMDDGLQNPGLAHDVALVVVDGARGFGNARLLPAGPLREPLAAGLDRADAVVLIGDDATGLAKHLALTVLGAQLVPAPETERLAGKPVVAFAGIGRPGKFFATLEALGCTLVMTVGFPDHHRYTADEIMQLVEAAHAAGATLATTEKDHVNMPADAQPMVTPVPVTLIWDDEAALDQVLAPVLDR